MPRHIHLICNAHIDPVWLWEWEEGAAETLSTFRIATQLCEANDAFIFNHNEVTLYKWVLEYEPKLFAQIQKLVKAGRWHIMGGWYLQPDCNMPCGESFVRQILEGKTFFKKHFDVEPTTAINFDPFGHTRGLVQILAKCGYDSYLFGRPQKQYLKLPQEEFVWKGYDGSEIIARRFCGWYSTPLGQAKEFILKSITECDNKKVTAVLWGVGNHGGGPSKIDLEQVNELIKQNDEITFIHSTPENYFKDLSTQKANLPRWERDLNPWAPGCYTSQIRVKQKHRQLENEFYSMEKMVCAAYLNNLMSYPSAELNEVLCDLLSVEFHDILPGSSIQPAEEMAIRQIDHGLEILSRLRARAFFAMASGQPKAKKDEIPILVYNPHPYALTTTIECEFNLADFNRTGTFSLVEVKDSNGTKLASQVEQELSSFAIDWRKRVVFQAALEPGMNRFDCTTPKVPKKPEPALSASQGFITFKTEKLDIAINTLTGLVDRFVVDGVSCVKPNAFEPLVIDDDEDPWKMHDSSFRHVIGAFKLMDQNMGMAFSGVSARMLTSVRVIEDGAVRSVIEVLFQYESSAICQRYKLPKSGTEVEVEIRVHWNQKDQVLKLSIPMTEDFNSYLGQVAYGTAQLPVDGTECVAQKWVGVASDKKDFLFTCINNGTYGSDFSEKGLRLTLLRSPAYSGHPVDSKPIVPQDRYTPRIDQGERLFKFWFDAGKLDQHRRIIDRNALAKNEKPFALSFFPAGNGTSPKDTVILTDDAVEITAMKLSQDGQDIIIRLFEPTGIARSTTVKLPILGIDFNVQLSAFEIKTLRIDPRSKTVLETNLLEKPI